MTLHHFIYNFLRHLLISSEYKKEVDDWLNSTECTFVFTNLKSKILEEITLNRIGQNATENEPIFVYLAADNEQVKTAFETVLLESRFGPKNMTINVMKIETKFVHHIKNLANMKASTNNEGIIRIIFVF